MSTRLTSSKLSQRDIPELYDLSLLVDLERDETTLDALSSSAVNKTRRPGSG